MYKNLSKLDWDKIKEILSQFVYSQGAKEKSLTLEPIFSYEKAINSQEKAKFLWNLIEKGIHFEIPSLQSLGILFDKAKKRGFFLSKDLCQIKLWLSSIRKYSNLLKNSPFHNLINIWEKISYFENNLENILNCENGEIKDTASYELFLIRKKIKEQQEMIREKLERIKESLNKKGYLQENLIMKRDGRYVLPVKVEYKNKIKGILQSVSQSGATVFIEPAGIIPLVNELEELQWKEEKEVLKILKEISEELLKESIYFYELEKEFIEFEISLAKANFGRIYKGIFPKLKREGEIKFYSAIHPLLILKKQKDPSQKIVYNDFIIEKGLLITGPNLGGKTVSLKTIGLLTLMAQTGFLIPSSFAEVPVFSKIFIDLGEEQDILEGESSFSSHLKNLKKILEEANEKTLVLLDEPGKGTNPEEGSALISAILSELLNKNTKVILTTHSQILKSLALKLKDLKIATMEYDLEKMEPTYKLIYGICGSSFAFELAKKLGFDPQILQKAEEFIERKEYQQLERILNKEREKLKNLQEEIKAKIQDLIKKEKELEEKKKEFEKIYLEKLENQLNEWQKEFKDFLKRFECGSSSGFKKVYREFNEFINKKLKSVKPISREDIKEGDLVYVKPFAREGIVVKVKDDVVEVKLGTLKLTLSKKNIIKISQMRNLSSFPLLSKTQLEYIKNSIDKKENREIQKIEVNLLGFRVDEALIEVERAINKAFLKGIKKIYIIHGHGTGKLRDTIRKYLNTHPLIKNFEVAPIYEGGNGVTIAYIQDKN
ncbi:MAG: hypothetical protein DRP29_05935 [Thermodesulfobacteriota bacterium]|nr:MAG: hypothetical protein DRP29_05935 [Thermodesulfobacteriota bacterium]